ncbi:MAG: hypothetical protein R3E96_05500 [Planctomycetota bacterium]
MSDAAPKKSRRWLRVILILMVLFVAAIAAAPYWIAPLVRGRAGEALATPFGGKGTIESLHLGWPGKAEIGGVALNDKNGQPMLRIGGLTAKVDTLGALRGRFKASGTLDSFELHLRQGAGGEWNWQPETDSADAGKETPKTGKGDPLPPLDLDFRWSGGTLVLHGPGGESRLTGLEGSLIWPPDGGPATLDAQVSVPGQVEPILVITGRLVPPATTAPTDVDAQFEVRIQELGTQAFAALADPAAGPMPEGHLSGNLHAQVGAGQEMQATGDLHFRGSWPLEDGKKALEQEADLTLRARVKPLDAGWQMQLEELRYQSPTASLEAGGQLTMPGGPDTLAGEVQAKANGNLERVLLDLAPLFSLESMNWSGAFQADIGLRGTGGVWNGRVASRVENLHFDTVLADGTPWHWDDPAVQLGWQGEADTGQMQIDTSALDLASQVLSGHLSGTIRMEPAAEDGTPGPMLVQNLRGTLKYQPDELGVLLEPFLPGRLSGSSEREVEIAFDGQVQELDPASLLEDLHGSAKIQLAQFSGFGFETTGDVQVQNEAGGLVARGDLRANGGTVHLESSWNPHGDSTSPPRVSLQVDSLNPIRRWLRCSNSCTPPCRPSAPIAPANCAAW